MYVKLSCPNAATSLFHLVPACMNALFTAEQWQQLGGDSTVWCVNNVVLIWMISLQSQMLYISDIRTQRVQGIMWAAGIWTANSFGSIPRLPDYYFTSLRRHAGLMSSHIVRQLDLTLLPVNGVKIVSGGKGECTHLRILLPEKGAATKCRRIDNFVKLPAALWGLTVSCRTS